MRVLADWALNATTPPEATSFGVISAESRAARPGQTVSLTRRSRCLRSAVMPAALSGRAANSPPKKCKIMMEQTAPTTRCVDG